MASSSSLRSLQPLLSTAVRQHQHRQTISSSVRSRPSARHVTSRRSLTPTSRLPTSTSDDAAGRVRVAIRVRPRNKEDRAEEKQLDVRVLLILRDFYLGCFATSCLPSRAKPVVESVLNGYNRTVMAYGQTGTGKTYTLG